MVTYELDFIMGVLTAIDAEKKKVSTGTEVNLLP